MMTMKNNDDDGKEINIHEHQLCAHHCFSLFFGGGGRGRDERKFIETGFGEDG